MNKNLRVVTLFSILIFIFLFKPQSAWAAPLVPSSPPKCGFWDNLLNHSYPAGETCCDSCGSSCGSSCASNYRDCATWSYSCGDKSYFLINEYCKDDYASCHVSTYKLCDNKSCGVWEDKGCGEWNCSSTEMYQSQTCVDSTDNSHYCTLNKACVSSTACQTVSPSCYTSGTSCAAQGGSCGNYTSSNCNGTVKTGLCPGGSDCVCCVPPSGGGRVTPPPAPGPGPTSPPGPGPQPEPQPGGGGSITIC